MKSNGGVLFMRKGESCSGGRFSRMGAVSKPAVLCAATFLLSSFAAWAQTPQGQASDIRVVGDFDGDGSLDQAVWRPFDATWYVVPSSNPGSPIQQQWGASGDVAVDSDYDGDGSTD
jgi:hypothetical protein